MLQKIRDKLEGTVAKVLIGLITVPFAVWGIDAFFTGGVPTVASVNGVEITQVDLDQAIELQRRQLITQSGDKVDPAALEVEKLRGPVLETLVDRTLLRQVAEHSGFRAGDRVIDAMVLADQSFQEGGTFSQDRFQNILASNGMSPMYYRNLLREEILINSVLSGLAVSAFATQSEAAEVARLTQQTVDVRYLTVPLGEEATVEVPKERVAAYFDENKDDFRTEETVQVEYLELALENLFEPVPEEELRREFASRMKDFKGAQERHAAHIMVSSLDDDKAKARLAELRARLLAGEDFAALARENSEDVGSAAAGGDLGYSAGDAFPKEFEEALAKLKPGEVSEPLRTDSGWHLAKLLDERTQEAPRFEDERAAIERALQKQKAEPLFVERSEQLADLTYNSDGLADAAKQLSLSVRESPVFSRRGAEGLFADARVIRAAFGSEVLEQRQNSEVIEIDAEHAVVLSLKTHTPARQQELAEVEPQVRALLSEAIRREQARERAQRILAALNEGKGSVEELAQAENLQWQVALAHARGSRGLPRELSEAVFAQPRAAGKPARASAVLAGGEVVVFETDNFREGDIAQMPEEQRKTIRSLLAQSRGAGAATAYRKQLREHADVRML